MLPWPPVSPDSIDYPTHKKKKKSIPPFPLFWLGLVAPIILTSLFSEISMIGKRGNHQYSSTFGFCHAIKQDRS